MLQNFTLPILILFFYCNLIFNIFLSKDFTGVGVKRSILENVDADEDEDDEVEEVSDYTTEQTFEQDLDEF